MVVGYFDFNKINLLYTSLSRFTVERITKPFFGTLKSQNIGTFVRCASPKTFEEHIFNSRSQLRNENRKYGINVTSLHSVLVYIKIKRFKTEWCI